MDKKITLTKIILEKRVNKRKRKQSKIIHHPSRIKINVILVSNLAVSIHNIRMGRLPAAA